MYRTLLMAATLAVAANTASAWPTRPVTFIVPYPPGGGAGGSVGTAAPAPYFQ